jgi:hypothetical protein
MLQPFYLTCQFAFRQDRAGMVENGSIEELRILGVTQ